MTGQIVRRGARTWLVRVSRGRDTTGKRRYLNKTIYGTKKDAQDYLNKKLTEKSTGMLIAPTRLTLDQFLDRWLDTARTRLRERTFEHYKEMLDRYVRKPLGSHLLGNVHVLDIQRLYAAMQAKGLSARTVRYLHAVLSSAFKQGLKWGMLTTNPASLIELPKQERREMQALSPEQARIFQAEAVSYKHGIVFIFALVTGMRPEEYLALKWSDVDLEKGTATVRRTLVWLKGGGWKFGEPKTSRSRRTVSFPPQISQGLMNHRRDQIEARLKAGSDFENNDLIFTASDGKPHNLRNLTQRHFQPILRRAGLPRIRLYDLRHSCATLLLAAGEHAKVVSERLGHASITLTLDTYSHVLPTMQQAATEKLQKLLYG
jgi:integrase